MIYYFKGFGGCDSKCQYEIEKLDEIKVKVTLTELGDNRGTSITNMYEQLATEIYQKYLSSMYIENITWIEHYIGEGVFGETFDEVSLKWDGQKFHSPKWKNLS